MDGDGDRPASGHGDSMGISVSDLRRHGISLALGGGAARGFAHLGVLKVLEEKGIPVRAVAGTSAGSVVGAGLAAGHDWRWMLDRARRLRWSHLAQVVVPRRGLMSLERLEQLLERELGALRFDELLLPFAVVAVDLASGEPAVLAEGSVAAAVRASCSVPGIFEPAVLGGRMLVDGGLLDDVPVEAARQLGGGPVVAVTLNGSARQRPAPHSIADVIFYSLEILARSGTQAGLATADLLIAPMLEGFGYRNLRRRDELVAIGERAALMALGRLPVS